MLLLIPKDVVHLIYRLLYAEVIKQYREVWLTSRRAAHRQTRNNIMHWDRKYNCFRNKNGFMSANYRRISYINDRDMYYFLHEKTIRQFYNYNKDSGLPLPPRYVYSGFTNQSIIERVHVIIVTIWNYFASN